MNINSNTRIYVTWLLFLGTAYIKMATYMSLPFLAVYLFKYADLSPLIIGIIIGASPLAALFGGYIGGHLSDRFTRESIIRISLFGSFLSFFCFYWLLSNTDSFGLVLLFVVSATHGFFSALFQPSSQTLLSDLTPDYDKNRIFQIRYAALNIGAAIGPLVGVILGITATKTVFLFTSILYFTYFCLIWIALRYLPKLAVHKPINIGFFASLKIINRDARFRYFLIAGILFNICYAQIESSLPQYLMYLFSNGPTLYSYLLSVNCIAVLLFQIPAYYLSQRISPSYLMMGGMLIACLSFISFIVAENNIWLFVIGITLISLSEALVFPIASYYIDKIAPANLRGTYFGAAMLRQLGLAIGPIIGGYFLSTFGGTVLFIIIIGFVLLSCLFQYFGQCMADKTDVVLPLLKGNLS
jgi:MFS family permease